MGLNLMNDVFCNVTLTEPFSLSYLSYQFWEDVGDPRVSDYLIIKSGPLLTLAIIGCYLCFSLYLGPKLMASRQPFKLRGLILCYNIVMVVLNIKYLLFVINYIDYGKALFIIGLYKRNDTSAQTIYDLDQAHGLFITKFIDLLDTIFFVLRKKQQHVSVLHLYHHSAVPLLFWLAFRLLPTLQPLCIFVLINCTIHVLMYSYYALSSFGPKIRPYLWWKKYITQIQMLQFIIYAIYAVYCSLVIQGIPYYLQILVHIQSPIFLVLFGHFYIKAYIKNKNTEYEKSLNGNHRNGGLKANGNTIGNKTDDKNNNYEKNEYMNRIGYKCE